MQHKRGDIREDGMVFLCYDHPKKTTERWVTPERFEHINASARLRLKTKRLQNIEAARAHDKIKRAREKSTRTAYARKYRETHPYDGTRIRPYKSTILHKLKQNYRRRTREILKRKTTKKTTPTQRLLGCDWQAFRSHLESLFTPGMTWDNYGQWHVDHITPLAAATSPDSLLPLFHYLNTQPLWGPDNLRKGSAQ